MTSQWGCRRVRHTIPSPDLWGQDKRQLLFSTSLLHIIDPLTQDTWEEAPVPGQLSLGPDGLTVAGQGFFCLHVAFFPVAQLELSAISLFN